MTNQNIYTVGGTVQAGSGIYIPRQADEDLLRMCRNGDFAYVLTSRQMGKSSLMVRTAEQLAAENITAAIIDLNQLGVQVTAEAWYLGLLTTIEDSLMLETDVVEWWQRHASLGITQRLTLFFRDVLLAEIPGQTVIFVDEIDSTLSLDFTDDFFAAIRYLYNGRATLPELQRLAFVLVGVATPSDLIDDPKRTPFNIGRRVDLSDFTFKEARPFAGGLGLRRGVALQVLAWSLKWTGGHPYLTQRLCQVIAGQSPENWSEAAVDRLIAQTFLGEMSEKDHNLQFVRGMLTKRAPNLSGVISLYRAIRQGLYPVSDEDSPDVSHLKLAGIVQRDAGVLRVRNQIYAHVFNIEWIEEVEAREQVADPQELARLRALAEAQEKQVEAERERAEEQQRRAEEQQRRAEAERHRAIEQARAEEQAQAAAQLRRRAYWLGAALILAMLAVIAAGWFGWQAQGSAVAAQTAQAQEAVARATADMARATAQAESIRALNAEAIAESNRATAQAQAIRALNAEATAQAEQGIAEGKSIEALDAEATARLEASLADMARSTAQAESTRSFEAEATAQAGATLEAVARATAQAESTRSANAEATARAEATRADQARADAEHEADRAKDAEEEAEDERATAEAESTRALVAEQTAQAEQAAAETAQAEEARARQTAEAGATQEAIARATATAAVATAQAASEFATSRQLAARALTLQETQYDLSLLLSLESNRIADTVEARHSLLDALTTNPELAVFLHTHTNGVQSAVFSPDGNTLASASDDQTIILWDTSTRYDPQPLGQPLTGHTNKIRGLAFSPDGNLLASGSDDCTLILWDVTDRSSPVLLSRSATTGDCPNGATGPPDKIGHTNQIWSVAFNPVDGNRLASGSLDGKIILWDVADSQNPQQVGDPLVGLPGEQLFTVAFSPDGKTLASGGCLEIPGALGCFVGVLYLWDVESGQPLKQLLPLEPDNFFFSIRSLAFSPDGKTLASGGCDELDLDDLSRLRCFQGELSLWDVESKTLLAQSFEHTGQVWSLAFNPIDKNLLTSGSFDGTIMMWDVTDRSRLQTVGDPLEGPVNPLFNQVWHVAFSPDGRTLVSGNSDSTVSLRDVPGHRLARPLNDHPEQVFSVAFNPSPDKHFLASGTRAKDDIPGTIILWDTLTGQKLSTLDNLSGTVNDLIFNAGGDILASVVWDDTILLWDVSDPTAPQPLGQPLIHPVDRVLTAAFSPDGNSLAAGAANGLILLWDVTDPTTPHQLGEPLARHAGFVNSLAFSPGGQVMASAGHNGHIILWDVTDPANPQLLGEPFSNHTHHVNSIAFSPDGNKLASGSRDITIILWDISHRTQPRQIGEPLTGHSSWINSLTFSPDSQTLASGSAGQSVILWDVETGQQLGNRLFGLETETVNSIDFSPDGKLLAAGSWDKTVTLWDVDLGSWQSLACETAHRNLTQTEIEQFIAEEFRPVGPTCPDQPFPFPASMMLPIPTTTPTAVASPTLSPTPAPTATATPTATPLPTATPSPTPTPTNSPDLIATPTATQGSLLTEISDSTPTPAPMPTFTATVTPTPVPSLIATPTATLPSP